ncbi:MAG: cysteine--tRNA ligase [Deltaproteobacteria bacterium]|nr:cysteine--tRNA ligase [Deltaproteobacteria bacterium]MBW2156717.1 cysteine--tRNA ligase [Deltaproteobacteria bacterium]MBW2197722.1 cysteine--tRNA ligase [Deltaproteobacteria bacterium]
MALRIFNTLNSKKELFEPLEAGKVRMYVCGPTVYDACHIGHARSVVVFDVIARYLKEKGYDVTYIRNFTDVDDKIIQKANQLGIDSTAVAERFIEEFYQDMDALNVQRATIEPKATDHIAQIVEFIEKLILKGFAYPINGDVYYSVEKFKRYGKLSGRKLEDMEAGARIDIDERKQNPFDFALWKSAKPGEPAWDSPWGQGRPGWHIECSAMSREYLGETFDIHGGGKDLCFPHHENEIAQSESLSGKPFVRYWVHNGFVNINQEKMSKSLGNFLMIKDVLKSYHPETVRLFLLSNHYRSPIDFTDKAMDESSKGLDKIYALLERVEKKVGPIFLVQDVDPGICWKHFCDAMDDDFNSARSIGIIFDTVRSLNRLLDQHENNLSSEVKQTLQSGLADIRRTGEILGMFLEHPTQYFDNKQTQVLEQKSIDHAVVAEMVKQREAARKSKNWEMADQIRKELVDMGISLEDRAGGPVWKING